MGMDLDLANFIRSLELPAGFSVCDLGSLEVNQNGQIVGLAVDFYRELGCGHYDSIDGNGAGTITADINLPLAVDRQYDLVTDLGTGEHIFDQGQVFRTIHALMKVGGVFVFDRPTQRWDDHGFYNMQPNLIEALVVANGYELLAIRTHEFMHGRMLYGSYRRVSDADFVVPQQGMYRDTLKVCA